ncbi:transferase [Apiospora sp. TS-2023a]
MEQHTITQTQLPVIKEQRLFCRNQDAPRDYTQVMLCFPTDNPGAALGHLKASVELLQNNYAFFKARLAALHQQQPYQKTYDELRRGGFATEDLCEILDKKADEDKVKAWTTADPTAKPEKHQFPASLVHAVALDKGLVVRVYVYHPLFDGKMRSHFIDCLAAATRGESVKDTPTQTAFPFDYDRTQTFEQHVAACPELFYLAPQYPAPKNPRQPNMFPGGHPHGDIKKTSKVFVFSDAKVKELQELIRSSSAPGGIDNDTKQQQLSSYACVSALAFAHVVKARLRGEGYKYLPKQAHAPTAILRHEVDFRKRAFEEYTRDYLGNATVSVFTRVDQQLALGAASATGRNIGEREEYLVEDFHDDRKEAEMLAELAEEVKRSLDEVDEDYVRARLSVAETAPDPRRLGLNYDSRQPQVLGFNNWRYTGGKEKWAFPSGEQQLMPEAFRLARGYSMRNALILPQREGTNDQDILVSLSEDAMKELLQDVGWMRWVSEVRD